MNLIKNNMRRSSILSLAVGTVLASLSHSASGQGKPVDAIAAKFETYSSTHLQEKIYLHTDKEFYVAGEIVWFKLYNVDGILNKPLNLSKVVYAELLDSENRAVLQEKIQVENASGSGSFYLPLTLSTGVYKIRAYTGWMKNFDASYFFEKPLSIVNTMRTTTGTLAKDSTKYFASFFPEGGNLVAGLESKLAFRISDNTGKGISAQGFVTDNNNDTVTSFSPGKFGLGYVMFKPATGKTYKASVSLPNGKVLTQSLPSIQERGYVMQLVPAGEQLRITVNSTAPNSQFKEVAILAHTRQVMKFAEKARLDESGKAVFVIDQSKLGEGISHITVFTENGEPVCERLYFRKPAAKLTLAPIADNQSYERRQKVTLNVRSTNQTGQVTPADVSVAVYQYDSLQTTPGEDILTYLWLASDLRGEVESPEYYFTDAPDVSAAADNLMLTHGWRRFRWSDVTSPSIPEFAPEFNGAVISARVVDTKTGLPAPNKQVFLSMPGEAFRFYSSYSDSKGLVHFDLRETYDNRDIIFQVNDAQKSSYRVEMLSPYADASKASPAYGLSLPSAMINSLTNRSIGMQIQNVYAADSIRQFETPVMNDTLPFYHHADNTYKLDDYKRFTTMEEVLREYVGEISVVMRNGKQHIKILNAADRQYYDEDILVLVDGVPLLDPNKIFSFDPLKVKELEIVTKGYVIGPSYFRSMANFATYDGAVKASEVNPDVVIVNYRGIQLQREFYSPAYETEAQRLSRIPDFRNTLYWGPSQQSGKDGQSTATFFTSDRKGRYIVVAQGISKNGEAGSGTFTFEVK